MGSSPGVFRGGQFSRNEVPVENSPSLNRMPNTSHEKEVMEILLKNQYRLCILAVADFPVKFFRPGADSVETLSRQSLSEPRHLPLNIGTRKLNYHYSTMCCSLHVLLVWILRRYV